MTDAASLRAPDAVAGLAAPNLFVVGAMRAGTTSLYRWLEVHPEVAVADPKEPHWFAFPDVPPDFCGPGDTQLNERIIWRRGDYLELFRSERPVRYRAEASAMYLHLPDALDRLLGSEADVVDPAARFVVLVRHPVDRAASAHRFNRQRGREPEAELTPALAAEPARRAAGWSPMFWYRGASLVADGLARLTAALEPERLHVIVYDDLERDTAAVAERFFEWLGLDVPSGLDLGAHNRSGEARSATLARLVGHGPLKRRLRRVAPRPLIRVAERAREWNRVETGIDVPADLHAELAAGFADDVERIERLLARPLPAWRT